MKERILNLIMLAILVVPQLVFADQLIIQGNEDDIEEVELRRETLKAIHYGYGDQHPRNGRDMAFVPGTRLPVAEEMKLNTRSVDSLNAKNGDLLRESYRPTGTPMARPRNDGPSKLR